MKSIRNSVAVAAMALICSSGWALDNNVQGDFGTVVLPFQKTLSNVFTSQGLGLYVDQKSFSASDAGSSVLNWTGSQANINFIDDFVFSAPNQTQLAAQVASIAWTSLIGIDSLSMRLYDATNGLGIQDLGGSVLATRTVVQTTNPVILATSYFDQPITLQAGHRYAVEVAGRIVGTAGGNYSGSLVMTSTPAVPEPATLWMGLVSLAVIALGMRPRNG